MEPIWMLLRCYRMLPGGACLVLGAYNSAISAVVDAQQREHIPVAAWQEPQLGHRGWHVEDRMYEYKLEAFMVPVEPLPPPPSIELQTIH